MRKERICSGILYSLSVLFVVSFLFFVGAMRQRKLALDREAGPGTIAEAVLQEETEPREREESRDTRTAVRVESIDFCRISETEIGVFWQEVPGVEVGQYILKKRPAVNGRGTGEWSVVRVILAEDIADGEELFVIDALDSAVPQQYEYRVDVEVPDETRYRAEQGKAILASNLMICIDPGHYAGHNAVAGDASYGYAEGDFTLRLALELKRILKEVYGIDSYMTRESGSITLGGHTDQELDRVYLQLRGEYAAEKGSDLFISLHTNANLEGANGHETWGQPLAINKTIILVNRNVLDSEQMIGLSNAIGVNLTDVNYRMALSTVSRFDTVDKDRIPEWTQSYNDGLDLPGTVLYRTGENGNYYGVLRGAENVDVPGIIIEHGMHTVAEVRREAMNGNLDTAWAFADAYGIAYGFGFVEEMRQPDQDRSE